MPLLKEVRKLSMETGPGGRNGLKPRNKKEGDGSGETR